MHNQQKSYSYAFYLLYSIAHDIVIIHGMSGENGTFNIQILNRKMAGVAGRLEFGIDFHPHILWEVKIN